MGDVREQTERALENVKGIVEAAGSKMPHVVKTTVFLKNMSDFTAMNEVYAEFFGDQKPARTTVEAQFANPVMRVEIDCIAYKKS